MTGVQTCALPIFLLLSEVLGGYAAFGGFIGIMLGFGAFLTNLCFNLGPIQLRAIKQWQEKNARDKDRELDVLDKKLSKTEGDGDENALRNLRVLYSNFTKNVSDGSISDHVPAEMVKSISDIFNTCVVKLSRSYDIYMTAMSMTGKIGRAHV